MSPRRHHGEGSIYQRASDGRWVGVVEAGIAPGGARKRRTVTARTKRELMPKLKRLQAEVGAGIDDEQVTLDQWLDIWLRRLEDKGRAPRTLHGYRGYITTWISPHLGRRRLRDIRPADVAVMLDAMRDQGKSPRTRQQAYAILHAALEAAEREQRVAVNAASKVERPPVPRDTKPAALSPAQAAEFLALPWPSDLAARWWVALLAGLRQGEALGLRWEDVHLDGPEHPWIWVHQTAQAIPGQGMVIKPTPKSGKPRGVALMPEVIDALRAYRTEHGGVGFVWGGDRIVRPEADHRMWKQALRSAGLPDVTLHSARATAATWLDLRGLGPQTVTDMLGHAHLEMTQAYHRSLVETQAAAIRGAVGQG